MGFLDWLGLRTATATADARTSRTSGVLTPFNPVGAIAPFVVEDIQKLWGTDLPVPLTRLEAMRVPAVAKARALLHSLLNRPLRAYRGPALVDPQPTWLYRSDTGIDPGRRLRDIIDDHLFAEASLLAWKRSDAGTIIDALHVPYDLWRVDDNGVILVRDKPADENDVCWIPGPWMGLLVHGADTLRAARDMDAAWMKRVKYPSPPVELHQLEDDQMGSAEAKAFVDAANAALASGGAFFTDHRVQANFSTASSATDLFESGRNALRLDIANLLNLPAALLEGSVSQASLTYSTQEGKRNELFDYTIPYWTAPIEQALSQDAVVPRGQRVRFDFSDLLNTTAAPTGAEEED